MSAPALDLSRSAFADAQADRPVIVRACATLDTDRSPLETYALLSAGAGDPTYAFLLETAAKATSHPDGAFSYGRHDAEPDVSLVGYDPDAVVTVDHAGARVDSLRSGPGVLDVEPGEGDVLESLRGAFPSHDLVNFPPDSRGRVAGGLVGYLGYDAVYDLFLDDRTHPDSSWPDAQFVANAKTVVFDHDGDDVSLVFTPLLRPDDDPDAVYDALRAEAARVADVLDGDAEVPRAVFEARSESAGPRDAYEAAVRRAKEHIRDGDVYQCVVSRTREVEGTVDPLALYAALREVSPSPYMFLLAFGDRGVVGASPETLVRVRGRGDDRQMQVNPIAGTCERGGDPATGAPDPVEDRRLAGELLADDKERAEHTMLVDLARNDVRQVCEAGSVRVGDFMTVRTYSHVQHIESEVTGRLAPEFDAFDAIRAAFPAGTLTGAPKRRAMELIDDFEARPRGVYGGGVGYVGWTGETDLAIAIRTATVEDNERVTVQAGAGIVADSVPEREYEETERKLDGLLAALERAGAPEDAAEATEVTGQ